MNHAPVSAVASRAETPCPIRRTRRSPLNIPCPSIPVDHSPFFLPYSRFTRVLLIRHSIVSITSPSPGRQLCMNTRSKQDTATVSSRNGCRCQRSPNNRNSAALASPRQGAPSSCHCRYAGLDRAVGLLAQSLHSWKAPSLLRHR